MRNNQLREKIQRGPVASTSPLKGIIMVAHYGSFESLLLLLKLRKKPLNIQIYGTKFGGN
jgi:hypothetical protein